jgi:hypothetical protein
MSAPREEERSCQQEVLAVEPHTAVHSLNRVAAAGASDYLDVRPIKIVPGRRESRHSSSGARDETTAGKPFQSRTYRHARRTRRASPLLQCFVAAEFPSRCCRCRGIRHFSPDRVECRGHRVRQAGECAGLPLEDLPELQNVILENPSVDGPFGAKAIGEMANNAQPPAITAAIHDAIGVWINEMPATPERVLRALEEKEQRNPRREGKWVIFDEDISVERVSATGTLEPLTRVEAARAVAITRKREPHLQCLRQCRGE